MYKFAILGGMFNPIHNGHIYIAQQLIEKKVAAHILFMPSGNHPFKLKDQSLPYSQRLSIIQKAIASYPYFSVSKLDSPEYGINYTYNLIERISKEHSLDQFTFLIGTDNALTIDKWYESTWLMENVNFTVVTRNSDEGKKANIDSRFNLVEIEPYDISSTDVRIRLDNNQSLAGYVPKEIIEDLTLYWKNLK
jgi:nicotinate-nucleotide adenylyltransferase